MHKSRYSILVSLLLITLVISAVAIPALGHFDGYRDKTQSFSSAYHPSICTLHRHILPLRQGLDPDGTEFIPEDITLKDDAYHGSDNLHFMEWWYFDAVLSGGYSIECSIQVMNLLDQGMVNYCTNVYRYGELHTSAKETVLLSDFDASTEKPHILRSGKQILHGYINETTGEWIYHLTMDTKKLQFRLTFTGIMQGWKGTTSVSKWAVVLPQAEVMGTLTLDNQNIPVRGYGYHDHNWDVTVFAGVNFGWLWGKCNTDTHTLVWSTIFTTWFWDRPLLVINTPHQGYINILPDHIEITINNLEFYKGYIIPKSFTIHAQQQDITLKLVIEVTNIHHIRAMGVVNYWRYHVTNTGTITIDGATETCHELQIAEFVRFR